MITIVIADDEKIIRAGIKKILTDYFGTMITVTEARNGDEAYNLCLGETPDIVITDIRMPGMDSPYSGHYYSYIRDMSGQGKWVMEPLKEFRDKPFEEQNTAEKERELKEKEDSDKKVEHKEEEVKKEEVINEEKEESN